jgi:hypothetical protein
MYYSDRRTGETMIIPAYFGAPVRGKDGDKVDPQVKLDNVAVGIAIGQAIAEAFPRLDLFIPHEHEEIIDVLWRNGVPSQKIIDACREIFGSRKLGIFYTGNGISDGMFQEITFGHENLIPIVEFEKWNDYARERIARQMAEIEAVL